MRKQYTFQRVLLSAYDTQLVGKYSDKADTVMVEIDSSLKSFSIQLPDFMSSIGKQFAFKNLGANAVTLLTKNGQYLDYPGTFTKLVAAYSFYSVASNAFDKWLSLETPAPPSGRGVSLSIVDSGTAVTVANGTVAFTVPAFINGLNLTAAIASVHTKGVTGATDVQIRRRRVGTDADMLSTKITIGDEFFAADGTIDTSNDDIATGDQIYVDVDAIHSGTAPKGLSVTLTFGS